MWLDCRRQLGSLALVGFDVVGSSTVVWCVIVWLVCCAVVCHGGLVWFMDGLLGSIRCLYGWVYG